MEETIFEIHELLRLAQVLRDAGRFEDTLSLCDQIADAFGEYDHQEIAEAVAEALLFKGQTLGELELFEDELEAYNEVGKLYGSNESPAVVAQVARASFNTAVAVSQMASADESIATYFLFIRRYESSEAPEIQEQVTRAYLNVALIMRHSSRLADALSAFENLVERFGAHESSAIKGIVVSALASKAALEMELGQLDSAIESAGQGLARGDSGPPISRFHCHLARAGAFFLRGDTASCLDDIELALRFLPEVELPMQALHSTHVLRTLAQAVGKDRILDLVRRSPSSAILSPLVEALELEIVREAEQLREIEDVAHDLRRDLAHLDRFDR